MLARTRRGPRQKLTPSLLVVAVAAAVYLNTLPAQFTFDDSFAVVYNGDVTDLNKPLLALFRNDFWGQDIRSPMSHKSYRPLTTLSFRAQHWVSWTLRGGRDGEQAKDWQEQEQQDERQRSVHSRGARPFVFHLANVAAHALVTALVYRLACQLAASRRLFCTPVAAAAAAGAVGASNSPAGAGNKGDGKDHGSRASRDSTSGGTAASLVADLEPFIAALLFAVHPVHTEAVAGIVGHAELLCAALSIPALLCYMAAADGRAGSMAGHWWRVVAAVVLGWTAALTKEIGITIMGAMLCYDILLAPLTFRLQPSQPAADADTACRQQHQHQQPHKQPAGYAAKKLSMSSTVRMGISGRATTPVAAVAAAATELLELAAAAGIRGSGSSDMAIAAEAMAGTLRRQGLHLKLQRMAVSAAAVLLYVKARSWLAGDQLVRIYRQVENPIPFASSSLARKLTTGYLHACYASLLVVPLQLSADWSYACVEYVSSLSDPRNLATAALYAVLLVILLTARPWEVLLEWAGQRSSAPTQVAADRRWRLVVAAGLLVGPFFPASNILFYVGTFIGERLLYCPSVGYCILLARPLAAALEPLVQRSTLGGSSGSTNSGSKSALLRKVKAAAAAMVLAVLLCFFTAKTVLRNRDWLNEEQLFIAAQKVCWRSGKVQLNSGIIERRYERWEQAEAHFHLAQAADPHGFCEPQYHIALTLLPRNLTRAVEYLERGVACKYTAADSVKGLNQIYMQLLERSPDHSAIFIDRWAAVLARPELQRFTEAATYYENAASKAETPMQALALLNRAQALLKEAQPVEAGRTPEFPVRVPASRHQLDQLLRCMLARRPAILAMLQAGGHVQAPEVKQAAYSYLREFGEECRQPMAVAEATNTEDRVARSSTFHTGLMHVLQEGDVNDPWLQQEWGLMLVASGRTQEALAHLEVAGHIFATQLQLPGEALEKGLKWGAVLNGEGEREISKEEAAGAAVAAYRHAQAAVESLSAAAGARFEPTARLRVLCHLQQQQCSVVRQLAALATRLGQNARRAAAVAQVQLCLAQGRALGCGLDPAGSGTDIGSSSEAEGGPQAIDEL